jgi:hypothetical protein
METVKNKIDHVPSPISLSEDSILAQISEHRPDLRLQENENISPTSDQLSSSRRHSALLASAISSTAIGLGLVATNREQAKSAAFAASDALRIRPGESPVDTEERLGLALSGSYEKLAQKLESTPQNFMAKAHARTAAETLTQCLSSSTARSSFKEEVSRIAAAEASSPQWPAYPGYLKSSLSENNTSVSFESVAAKLKTLSGLQQTPSSAAKISAPLPAPGLQRDAQNKEPSARSLGV